MPASVIILVIKKNIYSSGNLVGRTLFQKQGGVKS